ncbi:MAG: hypothetical protein LPK14_12355 [Hymenobacteraceae bacterium]|nr:hypothetical protein [Hymenobacteraceae bacterium]
MYSYYIAEKVNTEICPGGSATYFYKLLQYLNFKGRLSQQPFFFAEGYQAAYGVSDDSFPGFRNRTVLGNPFQNDDPAHSIDGHILVLDALLEYGAVTKDAYEAAISKMFSFFEECEVKRIWVKFHPEQYAHNAFLLNIRTIIAKNRGRVEVNELPPHSLLERVAGNKDCTAKFYVFLSSVGLYAALCGRAVYSFANFVGDMDRGYQSRIDSLPAVFKKRVKFL